MGGSFFWCDLSLGRWLRWRQSGGGEESKDFSDIFPGLVEVVLKWARVGHIVCHQKNSVVGEAIDSGGWGGEIQGNL